MSNIRYRPAGSVSFEARAICLNAAYADYLVPLHVDADQVAQMDLLYDVDLDASVVAEERGRLVGMALLSRRGERGWISTVGTVPAARRRGIARTMMQVLIDNARILRLRTATLEVISENEKAHRLYRDLGFVDVRELLTWSLSPDADPLPIPQELLREVAPRDALAHFDGWHGQRPSWQRELETLRELLNRTRAYTLDLDGNLAAYCIVSERLDGLNLLDVGIDPDVGAVRAGRPLLQALSRLFPGRAMRILNVSADDPLNRALAALRFHVIIRQLEMQLLL